MSLSYRFIGLSLFAALGLGACIDRGPEPEPRKAGGEGLIDIETSIIDYECECLGQIEGEAAEAACFDDYTVDNDELVEVAGCIDQALLDHPNAREPFQCLLDAQYDMVECFTAPACSFTCDDGNQIFGAWVCDGESDCAGGEDERQGCPEPVICDGEPLPHDWVCDGYEDCSDGRDEAEDCEPTCLIAASRSMEACALPPSLFMDQVDECFGFTVEVESQPGECIGDDCGVSECDDGACAQTSPTSSVTMAGPAKGPHRTRATAIQAARHLIQSQARAH